jgi:hypothetical protein
MLSLFSPVTYVASKTARSMLELVPRSCTQKPEPESVHHGDRNADAVRGRRRKEKKQKTKNQKPKQKPKKKCVSVQRVQGPKRLKNACPTPARFPARNPDPWPCDAPIGPNPREMPANRTTSSTARTATAAKYSAHARDDSAAVLSGRPPSESPGGCTDLHGHLFFSLWLM